MDSREQEIEHRLSTIEHDLSGLIELRGIIVRWAFSLALLILTQGGAFVYGYAQLSRDVESIDVSMLENNTSTALNVLGQHGDEFRLVDNELARLRGQIDELRASLNDRTKDRFFAKDAERLERRIDRLENSEHKHNQQNEGF